VILLLDPSAGPKVYIKHPLVSKFESVSSAHRCYIFMVTPTAAHQASTSVFSDAK
jgi:hypothetical protein